MWLGNIIAVKTKCLKEIFLKVYSLVDKKTLSFFKNFSKKFISTLYDTTIEVS